jgi:hypothetical protein
MRRKIGMLFALLLISVSLASAIDLEIEKKTINDVIVIELDNSAEFQFTIRNLGESDSFEIYSLVDVYMLPKDTFYIESGKTKKINVEVRTGEHVKKRTGHFTFGYKIRGSNTGIQEDKLTIKLVTLDQALDLSADHLTPDSEKAVIRVQNKEQFDLEEIAMTFSSVFFEFGEQFSLPALETETFEVDLDKEKFNTLMAGDYILNANVKLNDVEVPVESTIKFLEKTGLSVKESEEGLFVYRHEIEKKNEGNLVTLAEVTMERNIISRLFTGFNLQPNKVKRTGSSVLYTWQQELRPNESLKVVARTNWSIPIIVLIAIIVIIILSKIYLTANIILKKKINFVKTKGGEFALKVSVNVRAKKFVEKINVVDKLPPMVKLYERYGTIAPDRVDEKNRRIEWNIESLDEGEDRLVSYIIYSKIGIVGRFELPPAKAIYEREGKIKETESNKVFFVSEPKRVKKEKIDLS